MGICSKKVCYITTAVVGVLLFVLGFIFAFAAFPAIIDSSIRSGLNLWDPESDGRENFESPPIAPLLKAYMFNCTNPQDVIDGIDTPRLEEIGPFVYEELREKRDISDQDDLGEDHIRFGQYKAYIFRPDLSIHDESLKLTMINTPLIGAVHILNQLPLGIQGIAVRRFDKLITGEKYYDTLFNEYTVGEFLFTGMKTKTAELLLDFDQVLGNIPGAPTIKLPFVFSESGFAAFNTRNDTTYREHYIVNTGRSDMNLYTEIEQWGFTEDTMASNISSDIGWWETNGGYQGSDACNTLRGTDGQQFHPNIKKDETLYVFQTDVCKVDLFEYTETVETLGVEAYRFEVPKYSTLTNWVPNLGFCIEYDRDVVDWDECSKQLPNNPNFLDFSECDLPERICPDTLVDITRCMEGAPSAVTFAYFHMAPPELNADVHLPLANPDLHKTYADIEPNTGLSINIHKRVQFNTILRKDRRVTALKNLIIPAAEINKLYYPMFWMDEGADLDEENAQKLKDMALNPIKATVIIQWLMVAFGIVLTIIGAVGFFYQRRNEFV